LSAQNTRDSLTLAAAIIIAGVLISASLFVAIGGATKTVTTATTSTTIQTVVSTTTTTVTSHTSSCSGSYGGGSVPEATNNFTTSCQTGITLSVASDPDIPVGTNQTIYVSLQNELPSPQTANSSGFTNLPPGLDSQLADWEDVQPQLPQCGAEAQGYIVIYNESGSLLMLQDEPETLTALCVNVQNIGATLNPYQTVTDTLSFGGYWTSTDANEPWINATYHVFGPGEYTIAAFDPWGQLTMLNFTVSTLSTPLYAVTFQQLPCAGDYAVPWSVTLGNDTVVMPSNATVPGHGSASLQDDPAAATIMFTVPPGSYSYTILPTAGFEYPGNTTGTVVVSSGNLIVQIQAECHP
jgi:hypothetical protein